MFPCLNDNPIESGAGPWSAAVSLPQLHGWADTADVEIVAVCDRVSAEAAAFAAEFGAVAAYGDAAEMLAREGIDFVDVVTTAPSHRPLVELAARHGKGDRLPEAVREIDE